MRGSKPEYIDAGIFYRKRTNMPRVNLASMAFLKPYEDDMVSIPPERFVIKEQIIKAPKMARLSTVEYLNSLAKRLGYL